MADEYLVVECKKCGAYNVTGSVVRVKCRKCKYTFFLQPAFDAPPARIVFSGTGEECFAFIRGEMNGI